MWASGPAVLAPLLRGTRWLWAWRRVAISSRLNFRLRAGRRCSYRCSGMTRGTHALEEGARECQGHLLGRPALAQKVVHPPEQGVIRMWSLIGGRLCQRRRWTSDPCRSAGVACGLGFAPHLTAEGAGGEPKDLGHGANAVLALSQAGQRYATLQAGVVDSAWVKCFASAGLARGRGCTPDFNPPSGTLIAFTRFIKVLRK